MKKKNSLKILKLTKINFNTINFKKKLLQCNKISKESIKKALVLKNVMKIIQMEKEIINTKIITQKGWKKTRKQIKKIKKKVSKM